MLVLSYGYVFVQGAHELQNMQFQDFDRGAVIKSSR